jgi:hypothetical protein
VCNVKLLGDFAYNVGMKGIAGEHLRSLLLVCSRVPGNAFAQYPSLVLSAGTTSSNALQQFWNDAEVGRDGQTEGHLQSTEPLQQRPENQDSTQMNLRDEP